MIWETLSTRLLALVGHAFHLRWRLMACPTAIVSAVRIWSGCSVDVTLPFYQNLLGAMAWRLLRLGHRCGATLRALTQQPWRCASLLTLLARRLH